MKRIATTLSLAVVSTALLASSCAAVTAAPAPGAASTSAAASEYGSMMGDTRFTLTNRSSTTIELFAAGDGQRKNQWYFQKNLAPGESLTNQGHNSVGWDNYLIIKVNGVPKMSIAAHNPSMDDPYIRTVTTPNSGRNVTSEDGLGVGGTWTIDDSRTKVKIARGADIDSGHWYQAGHADMYADIYSIPENEWEPNNESGGGSPAALAESQ